jgi:hypothetical protein
MKHIHTFESFLNESKQSVDLAYSKIDALPKGKIFDDAKNIEGVFKKSQHTWHEVIEAFEKNADSGKTQIVNLKDIHITQPNIQSDKVKNMLGSITKIPAINVVQFKSGEMAIFDGHHRLIANWSLGENRIKVNLVKL